MPMSTIYQAQPNVRSSPSSLQRLSWPRMKSINFRTSLAVSPAAKAFTSRFHQASPPFQHLPMSSPPIQARLNALLSSTKLLPRNLPPIHSFKLAALDAKAPIHGWPEGKSCALLATTQGSGPMPIRNTPLTRNGAPKGSAAVPTIGQMGRRNLEDLIHLTSHGF